MSEEVNYELMIQIKSRSKLLAIEMYNNPTIHDFMVIEKAMLLGASLFAEDTYKKIREEREAKKI